MNELMDEGEKRIKGKKDAWTDGQKQSEEAEGTN